MKERFTNVELKDFLADFEKNSVTEILEEGKAKKEILEIAKARGINLKNNKDLAGFKTIYTFTEKANKNNARLPEAKLLKALPTMIAKPVDIDHIRSKVIGHYIDYKYKEKENMVVAYGVFYKSNFAEEWENAKKLFKSKKLTTSYEIWCPKEKRKALEDGTYELQQMEIAGGALLFTEEPAFEDAKVLELAKVNLTKIQDKADLVYAKKHCSSDIIISEGEVPCVNCEDCSLNKADEIVEETDNSITNIKCSNCEESFAVNMLETTPKCPKCKAILDRSGNMLYPPQVKDFKMLCPACQVGNWLILSSKAEASKIRCLNCSKEYSIKFKKAQDNKILEQIQFVYSGVARCYQCNYRIPFDGSSHTKTRTFKCPKCGLEFSHNINEQDKYRTIASIQEIEVKSDNSLENSKEGGKKMETKETKKDVVEAKEEKVETTPEVKTSETKESPKTAEKVEDKKEAKPAEKPKEEVKTEPKVAEVKVEKVEVVEKPTTTPADMEYESQFAKKDELEIIVDKSIEIAKLKDTLETAKDESELRKSLSDNMFAIVVAVKNKRTGIVKKIRKFPILEEAQIKTALTILGQAKTKATLIKYNISVNAVKRKIIKRAKQLKLKSLKAKDTKNIAKVETLKDGVRKVVKRLIKANKKVELYKSSAQEILKRRAELVDSKLSDEEILNDDKFALAKAEKENSLLKASANEGNEIVSSGVVRDDAWYANKRKEINKQAGLA